MIRSFSSFIFLICWTLFLSFVAAIVVSCTSSGLGDETDEEFSSDKFVRESSTQFVDDGGTVPILDLPMLAPYASMCTQGVNGASSHYSFSTYFDIDFDTSNKLKEPLYAPVSGTAYIHTEDAKHNFGKHVNIDLSDGTYVIVGHLSDIVVTNGQVVVAGQLIGYEGCTGYCSGDHVHMGLHRGDAKQMGQYGTSVPARYRVTDRTKHGSEGVLNATQLVCGIAALGDKQNGHTYLSSLQPVSQKVSQTPSTDPSIKTAATSSSDDVWVNDFGLDGQQETLMMRDSRWLSSAAIGQDAFVWGTGGCFDQVLTESDRVHAENGYYHLDFSNIGHACFGDLTLVSSVGSDGNPPNASMSNWIWWQNTPFCSLGSSFCQLQNNGANWEEWMLRVSWNPNGSLMPIGNGFIKNSQFK